MAAEEWERQPSARRSLTDWPALCAQRTGLRSRDPHSPCSDP